MNYIYPIIILLCATTIDAAQATASSLSSSSSSSAATGGQVVVDAKSATAATAAGKQRKVAGVDQEFAGHIITPGVLNRSVQAAAQKAQEEKRRQAAAQIQEKIRTGKDLLAKIRKEPSMYAVQKKWLKYFKAAIKYNDEDYPLLADYYQAKVIVDFHNSQDIGLYYSPGTHLILSPATVLPHPAFAPQPQPAHHQAPQVSSASAAAAAQQKKQVGQVAPEDAKLRRGREVFAEMCRNPSLFTVRNESRQQFNDAFRTANYRLLADYYDSKIILMWGSRSFDVDYSKGKYSNLSQKDIDVAVAKKGRAAEAIQGLIEQGKQLFAAIESNPSGYLIRCRSLYQFDTAFVEKKYLTLLAYFESNMFIDRSNAEDVKKYVTVPNDWQELTSDFLNTIKLRYRQAAPAGQSAAAAAAARPQHAAYQQHSAHPHMHMQLPMHVPPAAVYTPSAPAAPAATASSGGSSSSSSSSSSSREFGAKK